MLIIALGAVFILLLIINMPVCFVLLIISCIYVFVKNIPIVVLSHVLTTATDSFIIASIPLFILAANIMQRGGITERILFFSKALVGHLTGGLAHVNVISNMIFAGMSGSALADAGGLGLVEIEMMEKGGYNIEFSAAITAAASTIGPIIPPSIPLVLYGAIANESIGKLFLGGAVPGVLIGIILMIQSYFFCRKKKYPISKWLGFKEVFRTFIRALPALFTPIIIIGGIMTGIFTPTESAAIACLYAFILDKFIYKKMSWKDFYLALSDTVILSAVVLFIMAMAGLWSWMLTNENIARVITDLLVSTTKNPLILLLILNILILFLGMVMEPLAIMMMLLPILLPLIKAYGISTIHYGVVMTMGLMIGLLTPPFGECLFILSSITKLPVGRIAKSVFPYVLGLIAALFLVTYIPSLALWLPELLMK
ncbi:MAG: TRAP transporter large permease [Actinobacteria bacterium]|nr:TRAP transporter large permease [Actinomycetota bacterium]